MDYSASTIQPPVPPLLDRIPALQQAEDATSVPKELLVLGGGGLSLLLIFFGVGAGVLCSMVAFAYQAFVFFYLIETVSGFLLYWIPFYYEYIVVGMTPCDDGEVISSADTRAGDRILRETPEYQDFLRAFERLGYQWLVYWVVFSFFSLIETFSGFLLYWIPFYYEYKLAFLLWAMLPQTKGSKFLNDFFVSVSGSELCGFQNAAKLLQESGKRLELSGDWWRNEGASGRELVHEMEAMTRQYCKSVEFKIGMQKNLTPNPNTPPDEESSLGSIDPDLEWECPL